MFDLTICLIGRISAGKSTITKALSEKTGIPHTSFGSYLVEYSKSNKLPIDRKSLQELGERFLKENPGRLLRKVIQDVPSSTGKIIIEGIRHSVIANEIRALSKKAILVYIDATQETRYERCVQRKKEADVMLSFMEFREKDNHPVESEIESLKASCDLILNSEDLNIDQIITEIVLYCNSE